ncbi:MAG TPA: protealysin inhibitor emfourin [Roseiflexaceae bacterium]|jgi:hypothetical protein|nr:protealysin inhibitor emfourin [Roseiflexaceae bacterium]
MRITFQREGGVAFFPGLSKPVTIESDSLPSDEQAEIAQLIQQSAFFSQPEQVGTLSRGAADYIHYTVTVDDGPNSHTIRIVEPVQDVRLQELIAFLQAKARDTQRPAAATLSSHTEEHPHHQRAKGDADKG